jgi:hypothetical protein
MGVEIMGSVPQSEMPGTRIVPDFGFFRFWDICMYTMTDRGHGATVQTQHLLHTHHIHMTLK